MTDFLAGIPGPLALVVVAVLLFAESGLLIGVFLPGSGTVLALGWLAGQGVVEVWLAAISAFGATALGCQHGYFRGRRDGLLRRQLVKRFGEQRFARAESALDGRAELTVAASQCFAVVRTLVPRLAGHAKVTHLRFTICNVPVAAAWATTLVLLGAWSGEAYEQVQSTVGLLGLPLLGIAAVLVLAVWWLRRRKQLRQVQQVPSPLAGPVSTSSKPPVGQRETSD
ncbi:membrane-associated protein [Saccharopolyspora shandongensis]|uniref:Membrane-associated protein n=1 Tax=Saccharopolyspora shandongensis TaxID=418495 RepID=A0A1H3BUT6_9PSEU|nr:DedA family protein [Saccharopolyspora shandongensis]SDX45551.1 membrane-associated protein [Saccharopolyspora shandongensis]